MLVSFVDYQPGVVLLAKRRYLNHDILGADRSGWIPCARVLKLFGHVSARVYSGRYANHLIPSHPGRVWRRSGWTAIVCRGDFAAE